MVYPGLIVLVGHVEPVPRRIRAGRRPVRMRDIAVVDERVLRFVDQVLHLGGRFARARRVGTHGTVPVSRQAGKRSVDDVRGLPGRELLERSAACRKGFTFTCAK